MGRYVQLGEVRTWYEEEGAGPPLVLLHPGGADSRAFGANVPGLAERFRVFRPDRRGHGRTPDVAGPITYDLMAADTIAFLEQVVGGPAFLVGHSDGAPVGLLAALGRPDLVPRLVFASGVFSHDGWAPGVIDLDEETTDDRPHLARRRPAEGHRRLRPVHPRHRPGRVHPDARKPRRLAPPPRRGRPHRVPRLLAVGL